MPRKRIQFVENGPSPKTLAEGLRIVRSYKNWSMRELAAKSGVSLRTILNVENGLGCSEEILTKLAHALRTSKEAFYNPENFCSHVVSYASKSRWNFTSTSLCKKYIERYEHLEAGFRRDPDGIQEEKERLRLGRNGMATGFFRSTTAWLGSPLLPNRKFASSIIEVYGQATSDAADGSYIYMHCLRGDVVVKVADDTFELSEHDIINFVMQRPFSFSPPQPITANGFPPIVSYVELLEASGVNPL